MLANRFGEEGTFATYVFVQAVYFLPYAVLAFPLATAALPRLAERAATGDRAGYAALAASTTRAVVVVAGLGAAFFWVIWTEFDDDLWGGDLTFGTVLFLSGAGLVGFAVFG